MLYSLLQHDVGSHLVLLLSDGNMLSLAQVCKSMLSLISNHISWEHKKNTLHSAPPFFQTKLKDYFLTKKHNQWDLIRKVIPTGEIPLFYSMTPPMDPTIIHFFNNISSGKLDLSNSKPSTDPLVEIMFQIMIELLFNVCICDQPERHHLHNYFSFVNGSLFWRKYFPGVIQTSFDNFYEKLKEHYLSINLEPLRASLKNYMTIERNDIVTIESFRNFLIWFGDLKNDFKEFEYCESAEWFRGKMKSDEIEGLLHHYKYDHHSFIIRLNTGASRTPVGSPWIISGKSGEMVYHYRIASEKSGFGVLDKNGNTSLFPAVSLHDLVPLLQDVLGIGYPLPKGLVRISTRSGYLMMLNGHVVG